MDISDGPNSLVVLIEALRAALDVKDEFAAQPLLHARLPLWNSREGFAAE